MADKTQIEFRNMNSCVEHKGTERERTVYFVGYLKGKRKKYCEQTERYSTPEEAIQALNLTSNG